MTSFVGGTPPGPNAGEISVLTKALRPPLGLSESQCDAARRLRRQGRNIDEIATNLVAPEEEVRQALATMRTPKQRATRRSLNVTLAAHEFVAGESEAGESVWETVDRLLGELAIRRAWTGAPITRAERP